MVISELCVVSDLLCPWIDRDVGDEIDIEFVLLSIVFGKEIDNGSE